MSLESATYVGDLVSSNPQATDLESQGDDHLRLIKAALQGTFTNAARIFRFMDTKAVQSTTYSVSETADLHKLIPCDASSVGFTVNLPSTAIDGWWCWIFKTDSTTNAVTIDPAGGGLINGATTTTLTKQYQSMLCWWDNQASVWRGMQSFPSTPYYAGGQDIPFSDIAPSANAKRILGAATATDFSEQTIAAVLEWLGSAARGDMITRGASAFGLTNVGAANAFWKSNGIDGAWAALLAAQSDMETGTSTTLVSPVGLMKHHPGMVKARAKLNSSGTPVGASYNVSSTVHNSTGNYTVTMTLAQEDVDYGININVNNDVGQRVTIYAYVVSTTQFTIKIFDSAGNPLDATCSFIVLGNFA